MTVPLSLLVIGYGNSLRRDDGAGLLLADAFVRDWRRSGLRVEQISTQQLTPDLALDIAAEPITHVVFVDARADGSQAAAVQIQIIPPKAGNITLGHHMDPAMLLAYAERLYGRAPTACVVTVPGLDFGFGDELSDSVRKVLDNAHVAAKDVLAAISAGDA